MQICEIYRGRLIDHLQIVVPDLPRAQRFYTAVLESLGVPISGTGDGFFGPMNCLFPVPMALLRKAM